MATKRAITATAIDTYRYVVNESTLLFSESTLVFRVVTCPDNVAKSVLVATGVNAFVNISVIV
jgi:hypothetical protein